MVNYLGDIMIRFLLVYYCNFEKLRDKKPYFEIFIS